MENKTATLRIGRDRLGYVTKNYGWHSSRKVRLDESTKDAVTFTRLKGLYETVPVKRHTAKVLSKRAVGPDSDPLRTVLVVVEVDEDLAKDV